MTTFTVSKIQVRYGLREDLPALDSGEFGWCVDTQQLFIGKGTLAEGAPTIGVTEILTEYSAGLLTVSIDALSANVANLASFVSNISGTIGNLTPITTRLLDNTSANIGNITLNPLDSHIINYSIARDTTMRVGIISVTNFDGTTLSFEDNYTETAPTGVTLYFTANAASNGAVLSYTTTSTGFGGNLTYTLTDLQKIT